MKKKMLWIAAGMLVVTLSGCSKTTGVNEPIVEIEVSTDVFDSTAGEEFEVSIEEEPEAIVEEEYDFQLKDFYSFYGMTAGTCVTPETINTPKYREILLKQFSSITPENVMKPNYILNQEKSIETGDIVVEFNQDLIDILDFAKENDLKVRGHAMIWYSQTPEWIFYSDFKTKDSLASRKVMLARMESYIKQVFNIIDEMGYSDIFYAYDIVNEAIMEDGSLRDCLWLNLIGEDYAKKAFTYARKYAPEHVGLYYNDYNEQFKNDFLVDYVNTLRDEDGKFLLDGVGFQSHLYTRDKLSDFINVIDKISALGVKVEITELDISLGAYKAPLPPEKRHLKTQGKMYYEFIDNIIERIDNNTIQIDSITFWGFCDALTWREDYHPNLYDEDLNAKYAFFGAMGVRKLAGYDFDN